MSTELAQVDADLKALTRLAHGSEAEVAQYERSQPQALALAERKAALEAAGHKASGTAVATRAPSSLAEYGSLTSAHFDENEKVIYQNVAVPMFRQMGKSASEVIAIMGVAERSRIEANRMQAQADNALQVEKRRELERTHPGHEARLENAKRVLRSVCKDKTAIDTMCYRRLPSGERIGDQVEWCSMTIDLVESAGGRR